MMLFTLKDGHKTAVMCVCGVCAPIRAWPAYGVVECFSHMGYINVF